MHATEISFIFVIYWIIYLKFVELIFTFFCGFLASQNTSFFARFLFPFFGPHLNLKITASFVLNNFEHVLVLLTGWKAKFRFTDYKVIEFVRCVRREEGGGV